MYALFLYCCTVFILYRAKDVLTDKAYAIQKIILALTEDNIGTVSKLTVEIFLTVYLLD